MTIDEAEELSDRLKVWMEQDEWQMLVGFASQRWIQSAMDLDACDPTDTPKMVKMMRTLNFYREWCTLPDEFLKSLNVAASRAAETAKKEKADNPFLPS